MKEFQIYNAPKHRAGSAVNVTDAIAFARALGHGTIIRYGRHEVWVIDDEIGDTYAAQIILDRIKFHNL